MSSRIQISAAASAVITPAGNTALPQGANGANAANGASTASGVGYGFINYLKQSFQNAQAKSQPAINQSADGNASDTNQSNTADVTPDALNQTLNDIKNTVIANNNPDQQSTLQLINKIQQLLQPYLSQSAATAQTATTTQQPSDSSSITSTPDNTDDGIAQALTQALKDAFKTDKADDTHAKQTDTDPSDDISALLSQTIQLVLTPPTSPNPGIEPGIMPDTRTTDGIPSQTTPTNNIGSDTNTPTPLTDLTPDQLNQINMQLQQALQNALQSGSPQQAVQQVQTALQDIINKAPQNTNTNGDALQALQQKLGDALNQTLSQLPPSVQKDIVLPAMPKTDQQALTQNIQALLSKLPAEAIGSIKELTVKIEPPTAPVSALGGQSIQQLQLQAALTQKSPADPKDLKNGMFTTTILPGKTTLSASASLTTTAQINNTLLSKSLSQTNANPADDDTTLTALGSHLTSTLNTNLVDAVASGTQAVAGLSSTTTATGNTTPIAQNLAVPTPASQVVDQIQQGLVQGKREITMILKPEELGEVRLSLSSNAQKEVSLRIMTDTPEAHTTLEKNLDQLTQAMQNNGIKIGTISISQSGSHSSSFGNSNNSQNTNDGDKQAANNGGSNNFNGQNQRDPQAQQTAFETMMNMNTNSHSHSFKDAGSSPQGEDTSSTQSFDTDVEGEEVLSASTSVNTIETMTDGGIDIRV